MENYVTLSLETHLFFARIMREHALFLEAGFPCKEKKWIQKTDWFRIQFENLLRETVQISNHNVNCCILESDELVTEFTIPAENQTERLSGIPIDCRISMMEKNLHPGCPEYECPRMSRKVMQLNQRAVRLLNGLIELKECILKEVSNGMLFTANYPLLIKHIIREAKLYRATLEKLMCNEKVCYRDLLNTEDFWNRIMMEHALFIRGLLDPSEEQLIGTADEFANDFEKLLKMARHQDCQANSSLTEMSLEETLKIRDFKAAGTEGILSCEIASIILPLLADHVLREANHYIRLLECNR